VAADPGVALVERYVEVVNGGDLDQLEALFAPDFVNHRPTGTEVGLGPLRAFVESVRRVLPDLVMRLDVVFADPAFPDGARIGALVTQRGTSAQLGRPVTFREIHLFRIAGGRIAERWLAVDRAHFPAVVPADG
jgi:ketosteroid isomerase-like protein